MMPGAPMLAELRRIRRRELSRLRSLSVEVSELSAHGSRAALVQFAEQFVEPDRAPAFLAAIQAAQLTCREVDYGRWLRQDGRSPEHRPRLAWLSREKAGAACIRFDRRALFPVLHLPLERMLDVWAFSWPGVYVSFDARRAMAVSLDYDVTCCDLSALGASPYR